MLYEMGMTSGSVAGDGIHDDASDRSSASVKMLSACLAFWVTMSGYFGPMAVAPHVAARKMYRDISWAANGAVS